MLDLQSYLRGKGRNVPLKKGRLDLTSYMLGKAASGGIQEITGTLPLYVRSRASQILENYIIYGTASGAGVETENLFDYKTMSVGLQGYYLTASGQESRALEWAITDYIPCEGSKFVLSKIGGRNAAICGYNAQKEFVDGQAYNTNGANDKNNILVTFDTDVKFIRFSYYSVSGSPNADDVTALMLVPGSTAPSSYIPHGYKLPITVTANGTTTDYPIYIGDSKLMAEEYVDYEEQKVYKRTKNLWNFTTQPLSGAGYLYNGSINLPAGTYTLRVDVINGVGGMSFAVVDSQGNTVINSPISNRNSKTFTSIYDMTQLRFYVDGTVGELYLTLIEGSTPPETHIPYLQPTDPPVPLPNITLPQGEVTIDIDGELKPQATVKGKIEQKENDYE